MTHQIRALFLGFLLLLPATSFAEETRLTGLDDLAYVKVELQYLCVNPLRYGSLKLPYRAKAQAVRGWYGDLVGGRYTKPAPLKGKESRQGLQDNIELAFDSVDRSVPPLHMGQVTGFFNMLPIQAGLRPEMFLGADVRLLDFRFTMLDPGPIQGKSAMNTYQALRLSAESGTSSELFSSYLLFPTEERKDWGRGAAAYPVLPKSGSATFFLFENAQPDGRFYTIPSRADEKPECSVGGVMKVRVSVE